MSSPIQPHLGDLYEPEAYLKRNNYEREGILIQLIFGLITTTIAIFILAFNLHYSFFHWISNFTQNYYLQVYYMFIMTWLLIFPCEFISDLINTFYLETKYGFNQYSLNRFLHDQFIGLFLNGVIIGLGLLSLFIFIYDLLGNWVFILFFFIIVVVVLILFFFQTFFIRLTSKLTPLQDGSLKNKIIDLCLQLKFPLKRILVIDLSKKTTKANAFFTGFGALKSVVLGDNLITQFTEEEILTVVAHEIGHYQQKHIWKSLPLGLLSPITILVIAYLLINNLTLYTSFGFTELNIAFGLYLVSCLVAPLFIVLAIPANYLARKNEYEADTYGIRYIGKDETIAALKKLYRKNFTNLTPHPFVVKMTYDHPPAAERIKAIEEYSFLQR